MEKKVNTRTRNAKRNIYAGVLHRGAEILFTFVTRTVVLKTLGAEYTGLSGLFTAILNIMNVAELGFSAAVAYEMYKPIVDHDSDFICKLLNYYRRIYKYIGTLIIVIGIALGPFIPKLIKGTYPQEINVYILFIMQLLYTALGYFIFAYKEVIISANQRQDLVSLVDLGIVIAQNVLQIGVLFATKNYYFYMLIMVVGVVVRNFMISWVADKEYPEYHCEGELSKEDKNKIIQHVKGIAVGKINVVSRNAFDDVIISMYCGLTDVTIYDNYYYIMRGVSYMTSIIKNSILAGVGNSIASEPIEKNLADFKRFEFYYWWISAWCTIVMFCFYQPFMHYWAGDKLTATNTAMALFVLYFYIGQMGHIRSTYANAAGIWWKLRKISFAEMACNLALNFILGYKLGMVGVLIATCVTVFVFSIIGITIILFREYFKTSAVEILTEYFWQMGVTILALGVTFGVCNRFSIEIVGLLMRAIICIIIPNIILAGFSLCRRNTRSYMKGIRKYIL